MESTLLLKSFFAFFLFASLLSSVNACLSLSGAEPASIAKKAQDSRYVFDGVVTEVTDTFIKVRVEQYFKGAGLAELKIAQDQQNSCSDQFVVNQRALFFTQGNMGETLEAVYDGTFGSAREMSVDNFSAITAATKCMATYENGVLNVPCIAYKGTQKIYQATLEPISSSGSLNFSVQRAQEVTNTIMAIESFDTGEAGTIPVNWKAGITGEGAADWQLVKDNTAPSAPLVLKQSGAGDYLWSVKTDSDLSDGFVAVKFKAISGQIDQAAGLVWRWKDAYNYYVARANALEDNVSIYYMQDGERHTIRYEDVPNDLPVKQNVWQTLRVDFQGDRFIVSFEGKVIIDIKDDHIKGSGAVGLWTKEDSVTSFDDFSYGK